jgi:hypothetical protein
MATPVRHKISIKGKIVTVHGDGLASGVTLTRRLPFKDVKVSGSGDKRTITGKDADGADILLTLHADDAKLVSAANETALGAAPSGEESGLEALVKE